MAGTVIIEVAFKFRPLVSDLEFFYCLYYFFSILALLIYKPFVRPRRFLFLIVNRDCACVIGVVVSWVCFIALMVGVIRVYFDDHVGVLEK